MNMLRTASHHVAHLAYQKIQFHYQSQANNLEAAQRRTLNRILQQYMSHALSYEDFVQTYPVTGYIPMGDFPKNFDFSQQDQIDQIEPLWQKTFKNTGVWGAQVIKLLTQPRSALTHIDHAMAIWMDGLYQQYPSLKQSSQYWMIPSSTVKKISKEPLWYKDLKNFLVRMTHAVPSEIRHLKSMEDMLYATAVYLVANKKLGLIAVKHAELVTQLLDTIEQYQADIVQTLRKGDWGRASLATVKAPVSCEQSYKLERLEFNDGQAWHVLWPELKVVAVWEYSTKWIELFKQRMQSVHLYTQTLDIFPAKMTVPFGQHQLLNYQSYFFEFLNVKTQKIVSAWELKKGDIVRPIVTAGLGCIRCLMNLEFKITAFYQQIPCFSLLDYLDEQPLKPSKTTTLCTKLQELALEPLQSFIKY